MTAALEEGEWSTARPSRTLPPGKTRYPFYRRLGGPQGRSGRAENFVSTGIQSRTVQSDAIPTELPSPHLPPCPGHTARIYCPVETHHFSAFRRAGVICTLTRLRSGQPRIGGLVSSGINKCPIQSVERPDR